MADETVARRPTHTPGPWEQRHTYIFKGGPGGANVCAVSEPRASTMVGYTPLQLGSPDGEEAYANARLISAAPDLLAACKALASYVYSTTNPGDAPSALREANAAIRKAEGTEREEATS